MGREKLFSLPIRLDLDFEFSSSAGGENFDFRSGLLPTDDRDMIYRFMFSSAEGNTTAINSLMDEAGE